MSFLEVTSFLWDGFLISLLIFAVTLICGIPLGLPIAFCSMSRCKPVQAVSKIFVWIIRGVPLMLQIFIIYKEINQLYRLLCPARHFVKNIKFSNTKCKQFKHYVRDFKNKSQENRPLVH